MIDLILVGLLLAAACVPASFLMSPWPRADIPIWAALALAGTIISMGGLVHIAGGSTSQMPGDWARDLPINLRLHLDPLGGLWTAMTGLLLGLAALFGLGAGRQNASEYCHRPSVWALPFFALSGIGGVLIPLGSDSVIITAGLTLLLIGLFASRFIGTETDRTNPISPYKALAYDVVAQKTPQSIQNMSANLTHNQNGKLQISIGLAGIIIASTGCMTALALGMSETLGLAAVYLDFNALRGGLHGFEPAGTLSASLAILTGLAGALIAVITLLNRANLPPPMILLCTGMFPIHSAFISMRLLLDLLGPSMQPEQLTFIGLFLLLIASGLAVLAGWKASTVDRLSGLVSWSQAAALAPLALLIGLGILLRGQGMKIMAVEILAGLPAAALAFGLAFGLASACASLISALLGHDALILFGGVLTRLPVTGMGLIIAVVSGLGIPLFAGFIPLWLVMQGGIASLELTHIGLRLSIMLAIIGFAGGWLWFVLAWVRGLGLVCLGPMRSYSLQEPVDMSGMAKISVFALLGFLILGGIFPLPLFMMGREIMSILLGANVPVLSSQGLLFQPDFVVNGLNMAVLALLLVGSIISLRYAIGLAQRHRPVYWKRRTEMRWAEGRGIGDQDAEDKMMRAHSRLAAPDPFPSVVRTMWAQMPGMDDPITPQAGSVIEAEGFILSHTSEQDRLIDNVGLANKRDFLHDQSDFLQRQAGSVLADEGKAHKINFEKKDTRSTKSEPRSSRLKAGGIW